MPNPKSAESGPGTDAALYERSGAAIYGVSPEQFAAVLHEVLRKYLPHVSSESSSESSKESSSASSDTSPDKVSGGAWSHAWAHRKVDFCAGLHLEELALARGCAAGNERAWQDFISRYRQKLHRMALHITRDAAHAAELADSLFADLYGVNVRDGIRVSKLVFYTGRGSLEGWLRTVMAQEFINRYRKQKRTVSLEEQTEEGVQFAAALPDRASISDRASEQRLAAATDQALSELSPEDRFTLASYYLDGRTLAEIARTLGLHESSVSRRLDRLSTGLRKRILAELRLQGMSHAQAAEALETDVRDLQVNLRSHLMQDSGAKTFPERNVPAGDAGERSSD